jgi:hypothetical protein
VGFGGGNGGGEGGVDGGGGMYGLGLKGGGDGPGFAGLGGGGKGLISQTYNTRNASVECAMCVCAHADSSLGKLTVVMAAREAGEREAETAAAAREARAEAEAVGKAPSKSPPSSRGSAQTDGGPGLPARRPRSSLRATWTR